MVMHARKLPRIDDGYADKREAHSYQSSQYPSKASYGNHSGERYEHRSPGRGGGGGSPPRDSPRYINKSSYIEKNKERYERGTAGSPGKKAANHSYTASSNHSNNGNHSASQDRIPSRTNSAAKEKNEVQKSAIRSSGDWSEHISSTGKRYFYNIKTEVSQWEKPREWIDTSPSRPDRYSTDSRTSNDKYGSKEKNRHSSGTIEKREKHLGDLRHMVADGNPKPDKMYLFEKLQQSQSKLQAEMRANISKQTPYDHKDAQRRGDDCFNDYPNSGSSRRRRDSDGARTLGRQTSRLDTEDIDSPGSTPTSHLSGSTPQMGGGGCGSGTTPVSNISTSNLNISSIPGLITQLSGGQNNQELTNKALQTLQMLQQALSRQIAAHQTSVGSQTVAPSSTIQTSPRTQHSSHLLHSHQQHHHHHHHQQHHHLEEQQQPPPASQLHQHTQQMHHGNLAPPQCHPAAAAATYMDPSLSPYSMAQPPPTHSSPQPVVTMATVSPGAMTTCSTSTIPITHTGNQVLKGNTVYGKFLGSHNRTATPSVQILDDKGVGGVHGGMVDGEGGRRSSCCSPTPSDTSSQGAPVDPDMFSTPAINPENNLMATLSQYYNEKLVGHVTGWQGELVEKQARLYGDESLKIGSLISSQVSVELKRARSLVRVEEIQATLHEQRNLFLAQQISELENMKPVSSVSSFLPTST